MDRLARASSRIGYQQGSPGRELHRRPTALGHERQETARLRVHLRLLLRFPGGDGRLEHALSEEQAGKVGPGLVKARGYLLHLDLVAVERALGLGLGEDGRQLASSLVHGLEGL